MNSDINLLFGEKIISSQKKRAKTIRIFAGVFVAIVGVLSIAIFMMARSQDFSSLKKEQDSLLHNIRLLSKKQATLLLVEERVRNITDILIKREDYYRIINIILGKVPTNVLIESLDVDKKEFSLKVSSTSLSFVDELINNLRDISIKSEIPITVLTLDSLVVDTKTGNYSVSISADF